MTRELPLLIGSIGTVLGVFSLIGDFFLASYYFSPPMSESGPLISPGGVVFFLSWTVSPFIGLAGAFNVKKRGKLGGLLFVVAGALPLMASIGTTDWFLGTPLVDLTVILKWIGFFFWTPPLIFAGGIAMVNWPGPYVDRDEIEDVVEDSSVSQP